MYDKPDYLRNDTLKCVYKPRVIFFKAGFTLFINSSRKKTKSFSNKKKKSTWFKGLLAKFQMTIFTYMWLQIEMFESTHVIRYKHCQLFHQSRIFF